MSEIIGQADKTTAILVTSTFDFWTIAIIALGVLVFLGRILT